MNKFVLALLSSIFLFAANGAPKPPVIRMATTTSTESSGLLDYLVPKFRAKTGITVQVIAVGTGKAIKHGEDGDVDLVFVHAREAEDEFVKSGFGINRKDVMCNDFIILGPAADPAKIAGMPDAVAALKKIAQAKADFVSRGDESGTHKMEQSLWESASIKPLGEWYISAGQGMGPVLVMAGEKQAYTLADRGTYIAFENKIELKICVEGDKRLANPYGIIAVNPQKHPHVQYTNAMKFIDWIVSQEGQKLIASFALNGKQLFYPGASSSK